MGRKRQRDEKIIHVVFGPGGGYQFRETTIEPARYFMALLARSFVESFRLCAAGTFERDHHTVPFGAGMTLWLNVRHADSPISGDRSPRTSKLDQKD